MFVYNCPERAIFEFLVKEIKKVFGYLKKSF